MTKERRKGYWEVIETIVIAVVLAFLIRTFVFESYEVEGISMLPTLHTGERVLVNKLIYDFETPKTGQIIVFRSPVIKSQDWIKRVIGVPGDTISVENNVVYINGHRYHEPFLKYRTSMNVPPTKVPPGYLWVEGDNRPKSYDSRYFGLLPMKNVKGQAFVVWWPLSDFHLLH
ncbi:signal peptidase I [Sulfobacillus sp. hq2]|uniref:Signal peptidase I n=1 Tax=Sulfobacillus thermotolerans TaxID=338644 RepID=A0ABM6RT60_9FIRM|nr:signal peptidase I [Sulfobacillus sp. hq2]AUW94543.1 signal peptidase I [Sulfobacillus thermotolerans]POB09161.1 signal peptidase I [Sulfobacillus sp. hq2]